MGAKKVLVVGRGIRKEGVNGTTSKMKPGHFVRAISDTAVGFVGTGGDAISPRVVVEKDMFGAGLERFPGSADANTGLVQGVDPDYASNENVITEVMPPGSEVYAYLAQDNTAKGTVGYGSPLMAYTNGALMAQAANTHAVAIIRESVTFDAGSVGDDLGMVRVEIV